MGLTAGTAIMLIAAILGIAIGFYQGITGKKPKVCPKDGIND